MLYNKALEAVSLLGRRTQVAKGEVCKTFIQRFESARRLQKNRLGRVLHPALRS